MSPIDTLRLCRADPPTPDSLFSQPPAKSLHPLTLSVIQFDAGVLRSCNPCWFHVKQSNPGGKPGLLDRNRNGLLLFRGVSGYRQNHITLRWLTFRI